MERAVSDDSHGGSAAGMTPDAWARVTDALGDALDLAPDSRREFLARLHASAPAIAAEVESLVAEHERPGEFLPKVFEPLPRFPDLSGRALGAYRLIRLLGCGGMGTVYLAERSDGAFSKQVAVKLLSPAFAHARDRFHRERELLARLDHPHIARLLDGGTTPDGWPYLVMEYVEGVPIDRYGAERDLSIDDRLQLLLQVCAGVAHAHQRLIIHCDIKPENILVTSDGTAKLLDFGIARLLDLGSTLTQFLAGTPGFASPEQLRGDVLTTTSDVYAIGVLGYVLFTGHGPYVLRSDRIAEAVHAILTADPLPASRVPNLPAARARRLRGDLENILSRAVAKDPNRRYASAQQLADDLDAYRRGFPVRARADTLLYRVRKFVGRHRVACAAAGLSVATLVGAVIFSAWQAQIAARRFADLRDFAHVIVFDVDDVLRPIPGTTAARKLVVDTALLYLDRLARDESTNVALREELAGAYIRVGKVQGSAFLPNLGDVKGAVSSFGKALATIGSSPATLALERLRMEAHINIGLLATDPMDGAPEFDQAIAAGERQLALAPDEVQTLRLMAEAYHGKATNAHVMNDVPEHERAVARAMALRERVLALSPGSWQDEMDLTREHAQRALALMQKLDAEGALASLRHVQSRLQHVLDRAPANQVVIRELGAARSRAGWVLMSLGRLPEAEQEMDAAVALFEPLAASDPRNQQYLSELATAWVRLGDIRRAQGRLHDALALHRRALDVRRERARRDSSFMFVPWGLATSLNAVGELLLAVSPANASEARQLFAEAAQLVRPLLERAPSFNQLRRELAASYEGLGRAALASDSAGAAEARAHLETSLATWREVFARAVGDRRQADRPARVEALLAQLPPSAP